MAMPKSSPSALPGGDFPRLWCPPLTHYTARGDIDPPRMRAHWRWLRQYCGGFLTPGTTSDGWRLSDTQTEEVIGLAVESAGADGAILLAGSLRKTAAQTSRLIDRLLTKLGCGIDRPRSFFADRHIAAFTICPPTGADLSQEFLKSEVESIIATGLPIALYQLPQATKNEIDPRAVLDMMDKYPNLLMVKDTSGRDRIALSLPPGQDRLIMLRGWEGEPSRWLRVAGGPYHGLLTGSMNCFAPQLAEAISLLENGGRPEADAIAKNISAVMEAAIELGAALDRDGMFTNGNRAIDHFMAFGAEAWKMDPPAVFRGGRLPKDFVEKIGTILQSAGVMPVSGYIERAGADAPL